MNDEKKGHRIILGIVLLIVVCCICIAADFVLKEIKNKSQVTKTPLYGEYGLPYGEVLSKESQQITDEYVFFSDRILKRFISSEEQIEYAATLVQKFMDTLPNTVNKNLMLVPMSIELDEQYADYSDKSEEFIEKIDEKLSEDIRLFNTKEVLKEHKEEYIFFRTDDDWTALGAYYGAKMFCDSRAETTIDINKYYLEMFENFSGAYEYIEGEDIDSDKNDYVAYYLLPNGINKQLLTERFGSDEYVTYECPTIALSRRGKDLFVAGLYSQSIIYGSGNNGKTLLMIGDSSAKILASWLTPYYDNIVLLNSNRYQGTNEEFTQLFRDYNITDAMVVESVQSIGKKEGNLKFKDIEYIQQ